MQQFAPILGRLSSKLPLGHLLLHVTFGLRRQRLVLLLTIDDRAKHERLSLISQVHGVLRLLGVGHDRVVRWHRCLE